MDEYRISHANDPQSLSDLDFFNAMQVSELIVWSYEHDVPSEIVDEFFEKKDLEERKYYPQFNDELLPDKLNIVRFQRNPIDYIDNLMFVAKTIPEQI